MCSLGKRLVGRQRRHAVLSVANRPTWTFAIIVGAGFHLREPSVTDRRRSLRVTTLPQQLMGGGPNSSVYRCGGSVQVNNVNEHQTDVYEIIKTHVFYYYIFKVASLLIVVSYCNSYYCNFNLLILLFTDSCIIIVCLCGSVVQLLFNYLKKYTVKNCILAWRYVCYLEWLPRWWRIALH